MRLTFLGTGTSSGVPVIACDCATCTSDDPRDQRLRTGACLQWTDPEGRERVVLFDTTPDLRAQALRHRLTRCDAIFYTHNHVDHTFGLDEVRRFNAVMQAPIDVFAEPHTMDELRRVYKHVFEREKNVNDSFVARLIPRLIRPEQPVDLHGLRFTPVRLLHGRLPIVGFRVDAASERLAPRVTPTPEITDASAPLLPLAYCTDVSAVPPESWGLLGGLSTLVLSALRFRHHPTHLTLDQALHIADQTGAARTWFVHMSHEIKHAEVDPELPPDVRLAYDGLTIG